MKWKKLGHVYQPKVDDTWKSTSALTPTPLLLGDIIRVYAGFRDPEGVSRIGYVDVEAENPTVIKAISEEPVLDIGAPGCFDDNGIILGDVFSYQDKLRMYYVGFQLVKKAKFLAFTGIAESQDGGMTFHRLNNVPVLDRADKASTIRAIHTAIFEAGRWKVWYASGDDWQYIKGSPFPKYNIWYTESDDGMLFTKKSMLCIDVSGEEYRIGRPSVYKVQDQYHMFYTKASLTGQDYYPGYAISSNGVDWTRKDESFNLGLSNEGFDSLHLCYPRLLRVNEKIYCFYNGNNMGVDGFGVAELIAW